MLPLPLMPMVQQFFTDANGDPLSNGYLLFFVAGTSTPKEVFSDTDQPPTSLGTQVDLDDEGRPITGGEAPTAIYLNDDEGYKVELYNEDDELQWSQDQVADPGSLFAATYGTLQSEGSKSVADGYTVVSTDRLVTISGAADPCTINLPTVVGWTSALYVLNVGPHVGNIAANSGQTFNGSAGPYVLPEGSGNDRAGVLLLPNSPSGWWAFRFGLSA